MSSSSYDSVICFLAVDIKKTYEPIQADNYKFLSQIFGIFSKTFSYVY